MKIAAETKTILHKNAVQKILMSNFSSDVISLIIFNEIYRENNRKQFRRRRKKEKKRMCRLDCSTNTKQHQDKKVDLTKVKAYLRWQNLTKNLFPRIFLINQSVDECVNTAIAYK